MDLIEDGVNGYLVDVGDTEGLARRLIDVLELPEPSWQQMSEAAFRLPRPRLEFRLMRMTFLLSTTISVVVLV